MKLHFMGFQRRLGLAMAGAVVLVALLSLVRSRAVRRQRKSRREDTGFHHH
jgi:cell division septation protein DedD